MPSNSRQEKKRVIEEELAAYQDDLFRQLKRPEQKPKQKQREIPHSEDEDEPTSRLESEEEDQLADFLADTYIGEEDQPRGETINNYVDHREHQNNDSRPRMV